MTYVVTKIIKGNPYLYEVRSERDGDRVRQVFVRYLGRAGSEKAEARAAEIGMEEAYERPARTPSRKAVAPPVETAPATTSEQPIHPPVLPEIESEAPTGIFATTLRNIGDLVKPEENYTEAGNLKPNIREQLIKDVVEAVDNDVMSIEEGGSLLNEYVQHPLLDKGDYEGYISYYKGRPKPEQVEISEPMAEIDVEKFFAMETPEIEPEIVSTPVEAKDYIIKKEPEPFYSSGYKYMVYQSDGTPMYISGETQEEVESKLREGHKVASVKVEGEQEIAEPVVEVVAPAPEATPIRIAKEFLGEITSVSPDKTLSKGGFTFAQLKDDVYVWDKTQWKYVTAGELNNRTIDSMITKTKEYYKGRFTVEPTAENIYLRMPIERVRKDADRGVKLAQEALSQRETETEEEVTRPTTKQAAENAQRLAKEREAQVFKETEAKFAEESASTESISEREARRKIAPVTPEVAKIPKIVLGEKEGKLWRRKGAGLYQEVLLEHEGEMLPFLYATDKAYFGSRKYPVAIDKMRYIRESDVAPLYVGTVKLPSQLDKMFEAKLPKAEVTSEITPKFAPRPLGEEGITMAGKGKEVIPAEPEISEPTIAEPSIGEPTITVPETTGEVVDRSLAEQGQRYVEEMGEFLTNVEGKTAEEVRQMYPEVAEPSRVPKKSIMAEGVIVEESKEFASGENAGYKAVDKLLESEEVNEDNIDELTNKAFTSPYVPDIPKYVIESTQEDVHDAYHMGFGYAVRQELERKLEETTTPEVKETARQHKRVEEQIAYWQKVQNERQTRNVEDFTISLKDMGLTGLWAKGNIPRYPGFIKIGNYNVTYEKAIGDIIDRLLVSQITPEVPSEVTPPVSERVRPEPSISEVVIPEPSISEVIIPEVKPETTGEVVDRSLAEQGQKYVEEMGEFLTNVEGKTAEEVRQMYPEVAETEPSISEIPYSKDLDIRNVEALPRGTGAKYLVTLKGQGDELIAKKWARVKPTSLSPDEVLVSMPTTEKPEPIPEKQEAGELIAKNVERKISSQTGEDTDFITEYRLVKAPENAPREWMGNPWGVIRILTVGGEERERALIETSDTPYNTINLLPWESSYKTAEKHGIAKEIYDEKMAEQKAVEDKKEQEQKTELEDSARFHTVYEPLRSSKGAKSTTIQMAQFEINKPNIKIGKEGYDVGNGVGVVIHGEGKYKTYTVTHLNTGLAMGHEWKDRLKAIALAKAEAKIDDWSKYETDKDIPKETMDTAAALVRAFTSETMDTELASRLEKPQTTSPSGETKETTQRKTKMSRTKRISIKNEPPEGMTEPIIKSGKTPTKQDVDEAISDSVDRAIAKSKGKVGMLISGGVDSSLLLDFVTKKEKPIVFTIVTNPEHPDLDKAKEIAKKYDLEHHIIIPTKQDIERAREAIGKRGTLYKGDIAVYLALEEAREKGVDTILATDGIDEQTGGYWWHANKSDKFTDKEEAFKFYWDRLNPEHIEPMLDSANRLGVKVEYPFLDKEVVNTLNKIPLDERVESQITKAWFKKYAKNYVPEDIVNRPKVGFVDALDEELIMQEGM